MGYVDLLIRKQELEKYLAEQREKNPTWRARQSAINEAEDELRRVKSQIREEEKKNREGCK